ncbi:MAG: choice-of-anchor B domain-containing protein [Saprospiraceae bacterium]
MQHLIRALFVLFSFLLSISSFGQRNFNIELLSEVSQAGILTNDVWGYSDSSGVEYGVVGTRNEAIIYELSDPRNPKEIQRIPGASSVWRDFKSYGNFIYQTTDQGRDGLTVIDMTLAPDTVTSFLWTPDIELGGRTAKLDRCHNLWMDERGYAYLAGCNISNRGVLIIDVASDPYNPTFISAVDERYAHDVITRDTFLYTSEINNGFLGIYSIADPLKPKLISLTPTSSNFTHNAWTSDDGQYIFTTDERSGAFLDVYDISDPTAPNRISMYQPAPGKSVIPHNVHYLNGFLIVSWYSEGVIILDAHRPDNLVRVGQYDTHPQSDQGGDGCWGAYPFFKSGIITAGDINSGFFVLQPTYQQAAYLEGKVLELGTFDPINNGQVQILDTDNTSKSSDATGTFKTGTADTGMIQVIISHPEYFTDTVILNMQSGEVLEKSFLLRKKNTYLASGSVKTISGNPIANAVVKIKVEETIFENSTDQEGLYSIPLYGGHSEILAAAWGYKGLQERLSIEDNIQKDIVLEEGYEDDFFADLGWSISGDALSGMWERGVPIPTVFNGFFSNPNKDVPNDLGESCYVTGNQSPTASVDDVDDGTTTLTSPNILISEYDDPIIKLSTWFYNEGGSGPGNDTMQISLITSHDTILTNSIVYVTDTETVWSEPVEIKLLDFIEDRDSVKLQISVSDLLPNGHIVEAGIDAFSLREGGTTTPIREILRDIFITVSPNPVSDIININLDSDESPTKVQIGGINGGVWRMSYDSNGLDVSGLPSGIYQMTIWSAKKRYNSRFVKI